jgi:hypothetical protein
LAIATKFKDSNEYRSQYGIVRTREEYVVGVFAGTGSDETSIHRGTSLYALTKVVQAFGGNGKNVVIYCSDERVVGTFDVLLAEGYDLSQSTRKLGPADQVEDQLRGELLRSLTASGFRQGGTRKLSVKLCLLKAGSAPPLRNSMEWWMSRAEGLARVEF